MCKDPWERGAVDTAQTLSTLIYISIGYTIPPNDLRHLVKYKWDTVCHLAHAIHDAEKPAPLTLEQQVAALEARLDFVWGEVLKTAPNPK